MEPKEIERSCEGTSRSDSGSDKYTSIYLPTSSIHTLITSILNTYKNPLFEKNKKNELLLVTQETNEKNLSWLNNNIPFIINIIIYNIKNYNTADSIKNLINTSFKTINNCDETVLFIVPSKDENTVEEIIDKFNNHTENNLICIQLAGFKKFVTDKRYSNTDLIKKNIFIIGYN